MKSQRDALTRFQRYLPTLQLKKQQLQMEVRQLDAVIDEKRREEKAFLEELKAWSKLYAEPFDFKKHVRSEQVVLTEGNIAGVTIPVLDNLKFARDIPELFV